MLLNKRTLDAIVEKRIDLVFRYWKRPTVRPGGTLRTSAGVMAIDEIELTVENEITLKDARRAGYPDRDELLQELQKHRKGDLYKIKIRYAGKDDRESLRERENITEAELDEIRQRLARMDASGDGTPWTRKTIRLIHRYPGIRAAELAEKMNMPADRFKRNVRKLKEIGLTESLMPGYRLSPRGKTIMKKLNLTS